MVCFNCRGILMPGVVCESKGIGYVQQRGIQMWGQFEGGILVDLKSFCVVNNPLVRVGGLWYFGIWNCIEATTLEWVYKSGGFLAEGYFGI